jgi:hypothetical protein
MDGGGNNEHRTRTNNTSQSNKQILKPILKNKYKIKTAFESIPFAVGSSLVVFFFTGALISFGFGAAKNKKEE